MRLCAVVVLLAVVAGGCGGEPPPESSGAGATTPAVTSPAVRPTSPSRSPNRSPTTSPGRSATASGFAESVAVGCAGRPTGEQVVALLRRSAVLPAAARPGIGGGPLCAGTWQYTVLTLPETEPLHVITRGAPEALVVETVGTNPCTARVKATAPPGILTAIRC
jgi:hypothetical protein